MVFRCSIVVGDHALSVPQDLSFLLEIGLREAKLTLESIEGKVSLREISVVVASSTALELRDSISLKNLALHFTYSKPSGQKDIAFHASFSFHGGSDLDFKLQYHNTSPTAAAIASNQASWSATATYHKPVTVSGILSAIVGIKDASSPIGLSSLHDAIDWKLSALTTTLSHEPNSTSFAFDARIDRGPFSTLDLTITKSASKWTYAAQFGIPNAKSFLSKLGIKGVSLTNTFIKLSNGAESGGFLKSTSTDRSPRVTFAGTLVLSGTDWAPLKDITKCNHVDIAGTIGKNSLALYVKTEDYQLGNVATLSGGLALTYAKRDLKVGIIGKPSCSTY